MGNPLSPLLADIFVNHLELIIHKHPQIQHFIYWYRYVDDILTCFTGTKRQLNIFLNFINNIHPNIKFTMEVEQNKQINFLDLTIQNNKGIHSFKIFHKPSHTDTVIHNSSSHPYPHKMAAFNSMIHRLLNVPLSEVDFKYELNLIKQIAVNNGYNPQLINNIYNKKIHKIAINLIFPIPKNPINTYNTFTYLGTNMRQLCTFLNKNNIKFTFKTNNNLRNFIKNNKDKTSKNNKSGVYQLTCADCPKTYIGQTGRCFKTRINEHRKSFINQKTDSTFANHLINENHNFNPNFKILHIENKSMKLNLLESMEINKLKKKTDIILNDQIDTNNSPLLNLF